MSKASDMVRTEVNRLSPYNSGLTIDEVQQRYAPARIAKLGSNENPLGPSPTLATMMHAGSEMFRLYPDPAGRKLRQAIGDKYAVTEDQIILGNGSEDLLSIISRAVLRPGDAVVTLYPSFPLHEDYATLMGATVKRVVVNDDLTINVDALVEAVRERPRMLLFSNPMNPVGSWLSGGDLSRVLDATSDETLIVIDEAYAEYAVGDDYTSSPPYLSRCDRPWIVLRTFSKAFGLAGLRIGFGIVGDPELRALLDRVRTPFNANAMAQAAALAALADEDHLARVVALATAERARVETFLRSKGLDVAASRGNFLFFNCRQDASVIVESLLRQGVIVKPWKQQGFNTYVRVSIGSASENDHFMAALSELL
ncbi:histidinol-phosphate transaminase [Mesorhizobium sp. M7A.F.Ca.US.008.03.1.1]|uniref:histidinol-phosphate transaminase n=1 Tax=Mesorhizobium sp. M7A.F.Ca.US.008.03.1.1 TaxID=2496742 RepID=UPI000FCC0C34|nr:histidinol-phosphate transaminase [Mesorhizobium sp. M7A.F.Ca.US.008.03.1.1]RUW63475.1 histidinol-phosphate transaminase [Mesorhizobium sp. M7A.F.Ca.US.008.03.1.1]